MKKKLVVLLCLISLVMLASCSLDRLLYGDAPSDAVITRVFGNYYDQTKHILDGTYRNYNVACKGDINFTGETLGVQIQYTGSVNAGKETFTYTMEYLNHIATLIFDGNSETIKYDGDTVTRKELENYNSTIYEVVNNYDFNLKNYSSLEGTTTMRYGGATVVRTISFDGATYDAKMNYDGKSANGKEISYSLEYIGTYSNYYNSVSLTGFKINDKPLNAEQLSSNSYKIGLYVRSDAFLCII